MAQLPSYMSKVTLFSRKFGHPSEFWSVIRAEAWLTGLAATRLKIAPRARVDEISTSEAP